MSKYQNEVCDYGVPSEIAVIQKERVLSEHGLLAERVSAAVRLITTTENQERVLFLRKRGFGSETATYTDLAGALMMPRSSLRGLLQTLPEGIVPNPLCAQQKEWYQAETGEVERVVKNDSQIKIVTEWVNGYQIQQVNIDTESNREECDVRVLGFGDLKAQAQFETAVEMSGRWNETLMFPLNRLSLLFLTVEFLAKLERKLIAWMHKYRLIPNRDLVLFGRSVGLDASEDVRTQSLFGDSDRSAQLCLSSQLFV